jgi:FkbM family methyltransferase
VLPPNTFFPYNWNEPWRRYEEFGGEDTLAVHRWHMSWKRATRRHFFFRTTDRLDAVVATVRHRLRARVKSTLERIKAQWVRLQPRAHHVHGVFVGNDRVLISTTLGLPVIGVASDLSLTPELLCTGAYDERFVRFIERHIQPASTVVDVGANIGYYTLAMAKACGPHGRVYAYEPNPTAFAVLRDNVALNLFDDRVTTLQRAAHKEAGTAVLHANRAFLGASVVGADLDLGGRPAPEQFDEVAVRSERLDEGLRHVEDLSLIKVDVEGGEPDVLEGLEGLFSRGAVRALDIEVMEVNAGRRWDELAACLQRLVTDYGARASVIEADGTLSETAIELIVARRRFLHVVFTFPRRPPSP